MDVSAESNIETLCALFIVKRIDIRASTINHFGCCASQAALNASSRPRTISSGIAEQIHGWNRWPPVAAGSPEKDLLQPRSFRKIHLLTQAGVTGMRPHQGKYGFSRRVNQLGVPVSLGALQPLQSARPVSRKCIDTRQLELTDMRICGMGDHRTGKGMHSG